ncbi:MAG: hypothetical protein JSV25_06950 [Spirochaetota bacterium]|nr:MAG: hypothetical protein JSV25_06950 [Spirochaetota bacterium]
MYIVKILFRKISIVILFALIFILSHASFSFSATLYDLCYSKEPLNYGKLYFMRYKNPMLEPVLRTYELYLFDPVSGKLSSLQQFDEKLYIPPAISPDKSTVCYHSLIEGTDFLTTKNIEIGKSIKLRFDTGGYFVTIGIDYDNDRVAAAVKRGEDRQAIYLISGRASTVNRVFNGHNFDEVGFLYNGNIYFIDNINEQRVLGLVYEKTKEHHIISRGVDYIKRAPNGNAIIYSRRNELYIFRAQGKKSILISENFSPENPPLISEDGSTFAVFEEGKIFIVNIPSGDIFYYLSMEIENTQSILSNFNYYVAKEGKLFYLNHKKPGQSLTELFEDEEGIDLLTVSPNDRYIIYRNKNLKEIIVYDKKEDKHYRKTFPFTVQEVLYTAPSEQFYVIGLSKASDAVPVRELYLYDFVKESISPISTSQNTDIKPYQRNW